MYIRTMAGMMASLLLFWGIADVLDRMFVNEDEWMRILWHHFYENIGKIDNIYIGSSHVFCDIDTTILDQLNGQYNFNLAAPSQVLIGSYYLLREQEEYKNYQFEKVFKDGNGKDIYEKQGVFKSTREYKDSLKLR